MRNAIGLGVGFGVLVLAGALAGGCSSSSTNNPAPAVDAGGDAPGATGTLTLIVASTFVRDASKKPTPLAAANVAFDPPGGADRMEAVSGPDGKVTFTGIDWSKGTGTVIGWAPQRTIAAITNISPDTLHAAPKYFDVDQDSFVIVLASLFTSDEYMDVTGAITNKADPKHPTTIAATTGGPAFQNSVGTYSTRVPKDKPFTIFATEWQQEKTPPAIQTFLKWVKVDAAAGTAKVDVDFAALPALPTAKASLTYVLPGGASGPLGGATGYFLAEPVNAQAPLGFAVEQAASSDGASVAVKVETVTSPGIPALAFNVLQTKDGTFSIKLYGTPPVDGSTIDDFMAPPAVTVDTVKITDPIQIDGLPNDGLTGVQFLNLDGEVALAVIYFGPVGKSSVTITGPKLPAGASTLLGSNSLTARATLQRVDDFVPEVPDFSRHFAVSRTFAASK